MKYRVRHPCVDCRTPCYGVRCRRCATARSVARPRRPGLSNDWGERKRRAGVVRRHREEYGNWCPGYGRGPHAALDLCADHIVPVAQGGSEHGPLRVLCRSCNSRKRDRVALPSSSTSTFTDSSRAW